MQWISSVIMLYAPFNLISGNYNIDPVFLTVYKFREASIRSRQEFQINFLSFFPITLIQFLFLGCYYLNEKVSRNFGKSNLRRIWFLKKVARKSWKKRRREKFCCNSNSQRDDPNSWDEEEEGDRKSKVGKFLETWHRSDAEGGRHLAINAFPLSRWNFISFSSRFVWRNSSLHIEREDKKKKGNVHDTPRIKIKNSLVKNSVSKNDR